MTVSKAAAKGHAPPGQRFTVTFDRTQTAGHPCGLYRGYKVIPSQHTYDVKRGETWEVEEIVRWEAGGTTRITKFGELSKHITRGPVIYVWPVRRVT